MKTTKAVAAGLAVLVLGALASTGYLAWFCGYIAWWPFKTHQWLIHCMERNPDRQMHALFIFLGFALAAGLVANFCRREAKTEKEFGSSKWATIQDVIAAGLIMAPAQKSKLIRVLGKFGTHILTYIGDAHVLVIGGNRSGKGRGIVVPTALSYAGGIVFHDSKGELFHGDQKKKFPGTAGFRKALGHRVVYFNPTDPRSARYNPLLGVRKGDTEIRDLQSLIIILMGRAPKDFWERGGGRMVLAIGLHLLYCEPNSEKSLSGMGRFIDRGDEGLERIITASAHPVAVQIAKSFFPGGLGTKDGDKIKGMRAGLYFTARNFLNPFDDPVVEAVTSGLSQFEPADLVRHSSPTDLYLVMPAGDQEQDSTIMGLIISQILRDLMGPVLDKTVSGHTKHHDVLLLLDEAAALGPMGDFRKKLPQMPGYSITSMMVYQSLAQLIDVHGPSNDIIDNCGAVVTFAAADPATQQRVSTMVGNAAETEPTVSTSRPVGAWFGGVTTTGEREIYRPVLDTGGVRELPSDTELVFVNGAKPIKAKKLQYDKEKVFRERLLPPPPIGDGKGNFPGLRLISTPWWDLQVQTQTTTTQPPAPALSADDVPDFQPEW